VTCETKPGQRQAEESRSVDIFRRQRRPHCFGQRGVRCSLLKPDPAQRPRLEEIRDNLGARITEAHREGWLGEIEGLQVSLAGAQQKLTQLDATTDRLANAVNIGMPTFAHIAGREGTAAPAEVSRRTNQTANA
jgi:hypothetical protein